ncbi:hypothetical protein ACFL3S_03980 [Gemmatimonadota bacterium]
MIARVPRWSLIVWILILGSGCDNVSWGGFHVGLQGPPSDSTDPFSDTASAQSDVPSTPEIGPLLFAAVRDADTAFVYPVASGSPGGFRPLLAGDDGRRWTEEILHRLRPGTRLSLFSQGVRVGTFYAAGEAATASEYCIPRPRAHGRIELVPGAVEAQNFLALEASTWDRFPVLAYSPLRSQYAQRAATVDMAAAAIPQVGARWPPSLVDIRQDLQVFQLGERAGPAVMATFLHLDSFTEDPAPDDSYSLLVLGEPREGGYANTYVSYRLVGEAGKGAPRYFSHLDWDEDGEDEILLENFGEGTRWWAGLDREAGEWRIAFEDPCGPRGSDPSAGPSGP